MNLNVTKFDCYGWFDMTSIGKEEVGFCELYGEWKSPISESIRFVASNSRSYGREVYRANAFHADALMKDTELAAVITGQKASAQVYRAGTDFLGLLNALPGGGDRTSRPEREWRLPAC